MWKRISIFVVGFSLVSFLVFAGNGQNPTIYKLELTSADTEYSQVITPSVKKFTIQCRTTFDVRLAFVTGKVAASTDPYLTIKKGNVYWEDDLDTKLTTTTLYLASSEAGVVIEIVVWR